MSLYYASTFAGVVDPSFSSAYYSEAPDSMNEVLPGELWLGDRKSHALLAEEGGFGAIMSIMPEPTYDTPIPDGVEVLNFPLYDTSDLETQSREIVKTRLMEARDKLIELIDTKKIKVLVHCYAGVSRSAAVVVAYLMHRHTIDADHALKILRRSRFCVAPNSLFMEVLRDDMK